MTKPIADMSYEELLYKVLEVKGIQVGPDATGLGYMAVNRVGRKVAGPNSSEKLVLYRALLPFRGET